MKGTIAPATETSPEAVRLTRHKPKQQNNSMKTVSQSLLGITALLSVPASVEEFNTLAGGDKILDYANDEAYYRGIAPKVRTKFLELIKAELEFEPRVVSTKKVGEGEKAKDVNVYEKDTVFIKDLKANKGVTDAQLQPLLQRAFDEVGWDLSSTRSTGPNKKDKESAEMYIAAVTAGRTNWDRLCTNFEQANPGLSIAREEDGSVTPDVLAEAVKVNRIRIENAASAEML